MMMTSHNRQRGRTSASPPAAAPPLCSDSQPCGPRACPPQGPPHRACLESISVTEETRLARLVFSQLLFCCQHCQRILDPKKKKKIPLMRSSKSLPGLVLSSQSLWRSWFYTIGWEEENGFCDEHLLFC